jgi:Fe2+ transport system protein FeoA
MNVQQKTNFAPCCGEATQLSEEKCEQNGRLFNSPRFAQCATSLSECMLSELAVGDSGILVALTLPDEVQNHLMHMGFVPDARVKVLRHAPAGDPVVYGIDGMEVALRKETASAIRVRPAQDEAVQ